MSNPSANHDDSIDLESNDTATAAAPINDCLHARGHRQQQQQQQLQRQQLQQQQQQQHHHHHLKAVSNLANGINRIAVNYNGSNNNNNTNNSIGNKHCEKNDESGGKVSQMFRIRTNTNDGDDVDEMGVLKSDEDAVGAAAAAGGGVMDAENASASADNSSSTLLASRSTSHDCGASVVVAAASGGGGGGNDGVKYQTMDALRPTESADDCDRSQQSSISGVSWDGTNNRGGCASASGSGSIGANKGVSSFRSRAGRKAYSPRWMDRKSVEEDGTRNHQQHHQHRNNHRYQHMMSSSSADGGYASLTEDCAVHHHQHHHQHHAAAVDSASFSSGERKRTRNGSFSSRSDVADEEARHHHHHQQQQQHQQHHQEYFATSHAWSTTTRTDTNDSHDEGYLSSTAEGGYHSGGGSHSASVGVGGYHSFHHPELSFAASVKSDIATGKRERVWWCSPTPNFKAKLACCRDEYLTSCLLASIYL